MWSPTHVQVTVQRAKNLLTKGKHKTNDCFVTIALGKEKYQTSVKEKASKDVDWHEECELMIPEQGNTAEIILTALHRNFLGVDEFLGTVNIPLSSFDVYERPRNRWYTLSSKPGKENTKERGELEVKIGFIVKAGSLTDLSRKERHKSSLGQLSTAAHSIGGSLLSIGSLEKRKGLKKLAKSIGNRVKGAKSRSKLDRENDLDEREETIAARSRQEPGEADPGVISEDEDEFTFDDLSHKSSASSLNVSMTALSSGNSGGDNPITAAVSSNGRATSHVNVSSALGSGIDQSTAATSPLAIVTAPNKPPRFGISTSTTSLSKIDGQREDEWGIKLYGKQASSVPKRWEAKVNPRIVVDDSSSRSDFVDRHENELNSVPSSVLSSPSSQRHNHHHHHQQQQQQQQQHQQQQQQHQQQQHQQQQHQQQQQQQQLTPPPPPPPPPLAEPILSPPSPTIRQLRETTISEPPSPAPREILQPKSSKEDRLLPSTKENRIGAAKSPKEERNIKKEKRKEREKENRPRNVNEDGHPSSERIIIGGEDSIKTSNIPRGRLPHEVLAQFDGKSREDLIELIFQLKADLADKKKRLTDLEDYIDALLLRVIECSPRLLQNPFHTQRRLSSPGHQ